MKPLKLCERLVLVHSRVGDLVLVPFGGSGSECLAAARLGRRAIAFESDAEYHQLMLRRLVGHGLLPARMRPPSPPRGHIVTEVPTSPPSAHAARLGAPLRRGRRGA